MNKLLSFEGRYLDDLDAQELLLIAKDTMRENERLKKSMEAADAWLRDAFDFRLPEYGGTIESNLEHVKFYFPKISAALWSWRDHPHKHSFQYNEPVVNEPIKSVISYSQIDEYCLKDLGKHISEEQPKT